MIQRVWSKWLMARRDSDIWGRPRNGPIIFCCNQRQVTVISPPVQGMHLTLKKQVIRSCYPGWHLILLAFIFRRGERFILEELCLLVQDTGCDGYVQRLWEIPRGKRAREELPNRVCGGGRRRWLLMAWAVFPAAAEPDLQPSLRAAAPLPRTPAREGWSRVMPSAAGSSVPGAAAGSCSGTRALSQNPALGLFWGTQMDVCGSRQGRRARDEPRCLQITLALPVLQPPSRWKCRGWESYLSLSQLLQFLVQ